MGTCAHIVNTCAGALAGKVNLARTVSLSEIAGARLQIGTKVFETIRSAADEDNDDDNDDDDDQEGDSDAERAADAACAHTGLGGLGAFVR